MHVAFQFGGEQQVRGRVGVRAGSQLAAVVTHGERKTGLYRLAGGVLQFQFERHGRESIVGRLVLSHAELQLPLGRVVPDETAAQAAPLLIEEFDAVHAAVECGVRDYEGRRLSPERQRIEVTRLFAAEHRQPQQTVRVAAVRGVAARQNYLHSAIHTVRGHDKLLLRYGRGQVEASLAAPVAHGGVAFIEVGWQDKPPHAFMATRKALHFRSVRAAQAESVE